MMTPNTQEKCFGELEAFLWENDAKLLKRHLPSPFVYLFELNDNCHKAHVSYAAHWKPLLSHCCTCQLSNAVPLLKRSFRTSRHYDKHRAAARQQPAKQQKKLQRCKRWREIWGCLLLFPLGWIRTGCGFITRDRPHVLSCTVGRTGAFSQTFGHYFFIFQFYLITGANSPQQAAPLSCRSHPAAWPPFFEEPQQETIHSAACCSAWERQHNTQDFLFICLQNQPKLQSRWDEYSSTRLPDPTPIRFNPL